MKANEDTMISFKATPAFLRRENKDCDEKGQDSGMETEVPQLILVPYTEEHVPRYHAWMQRAELLEATASERLDLAGEYESMRAWRLDETKLTFILLLHGGGRAGDVNDMVGDVNLCLLDNDDDDDEGDDGEYGGERTTKDAEVDVMIAEPHARRKGLATLAVFTITAYLTLHLGVRVRRLVAKILTSNHPSIRLFTKHFGFQLLKHVPAFNESHFTLPCASNSHLTARLVDVQRAWHLQSFSRLRDEALRETTPRTEEYQTEQEKEKEKLRNGS